MGGLVCDVAGDGELDLGSCSGAAPDAHASPYPVRALAHPGEPPVAVPAGPKDLGIDPPPVVAHAHAEGVARSLHRHLDPAAGGMTERVHEGLAADPVDVVAD